MAWIVLFFKGIPYEDNSVTTILSVTSCSFFVMGRFCQPEKETNKQTNIMIINKHIVVCKIVPVMH